MRFPMMSWLALVAMALTGCGGGTTPEWRELDPGTFTPAQQAQEAAASNAREALFNALMARVQEAMEAGGPEGAIDACKVDAPLLTAAAVEDHGIAIGRTSFLLRNPENQPPGWAAEAVAARRDTPAYFQAADGRLGVLLPIRLQAQCTVCHGASGEIPAAVLARIAEAYPKDEAVGFAEGDLRGYFHIEVGQ